MSNKNSNYPINALNNLPDEVKTDTIECLMQLANKGKPKAVEELRERINAYFEFCKNNSFRPGIESLSLALSVSRITLWNWANGIGVNEEWAQECQKAKQIILAFVEQASISNRLTPPVAIFLMKNLGGYKDQISFEESAPQTQGTEKASLETIKAKLALERDAGKYEL